jgi:hypothetical protein
MHSGVKRLQQLVGKFWLPEVAATRLAWLRLLVGGFAFWYLSSQYADFMETASSSPSLFDAVGLARLLDKPIPIELFECLFICTLVLNVFFILGLRFCYTGPLFAAFLLCLLCYRNSWSMIFHSENLLVLHVIVLGLTPSANALSLDAVVRRNCHSWIWVHGTWPLTEVHSNWRYGWPCRLIGAITVMAYWLAGVAKVAGPLGWSWISGEALRSYILREGLRKELLGDGATPLTWVLNDQVGLLTGVAALTLVLELGAPLFFLNDRVSRVWAVLAWGMHIGILLIMGIRFRYQLSGIAFASFFPLEKLFDKLRLWALRHIPRRSECRASLLKAQSGGSMEREKKFRD